jgi:hypothetical protein
MRYRAFIVLLVLLQISATTAPSPTPLLHAHAHNDYNHTHPLFDALDNGFCSIEADAVLLNGTLYVAHDRDKIRFDRALDDLYLKPLAERIRANHGRVYPAGPTVTLLIDCKSPDSGALYAALKQLLTKYDEFLTHYSPTEIDQRALTIILTGNKPQQLVAAEPNRIVACDGHLKDLDANPSPDLVPQISANWEDSFQWRGVGPLPASDRAALSALVARVHAQHRKLRLWKAPDNPTAWRELLNAGVDLLNTDRLNECRDFLLHYTPATRSATRP